MDTRQGQETRTGSNPDKLCNNAKNGYTRFVSSKKPVGTVGNPVKRHATSEKQKNNICY